MKALTGSPYIDDWCNTPITVYVDKNVKMMGSTVEGLRISAEKPNIKYELTPENSNWGNAITAYMRDGNFERIEQRVWISEENKQQIIKEAESVS